MDEFLKQHPTAKAQNNITSNKLRNRWSYKVYITPSKSFRRLEEDPLLQQKEPSVLNGPVALNYAADVNKIVRHIPGNGVEAGVAFGYNLTSNIKVTTGFQFNARQYYIEAFMANPELTTIALQTSSGVDTVNRSSIYRTSNGFSSTELINRYYQLSVPFGVEMRVVSFKDFSFNVAASVQPTYTLNNNAYLLSTDFKNYAESGTMLRNWNINTNIEAFLNFETGDFKWQLGPQFRYQQLPTFTHSIPYKRTFNGLWG